MTKEKPLSEKMDSLGTFSVEDVAEAVEKLKEYGHICNFHRKGEVDEILVIRMEDFDKIMGEFHSPQTKQNTTSPARYGARKGGLRPDKPEDTPKGYGNGYMEHGIEPTEPNLDEVEK